MVAGEDAADFQILRLPVGKAVPAISAGRRKAKSPYRPTAPAITGGGRAFDRQSGGARGIELERLENRRAILYVMVPYPRAGRL